MVNFCTLFDSNYLIYGLLLHDSLKKYCPSFHLYIFAFDEKSHTILTDLNLENVSVVSLKDFEKKELLSVKSTRSHAEYCWTCTPSIILHCLNKFNLSDCIYIDSDICFFANPEILIKEIASSPVMITDHYYAPEYDQSKTSGKYCVQFMYFKNTSNGLAILRWWERQCLNWCFARIEDGKFGDQKYLDDWPERFSGVNVFKNRGAGLAPWNAKKYRLMISSNDKAIFMHDKLTKIKYPLVFYHFHALKPYKNGYLKLSNSTYLLNKDLLKNVYKPYVSAYLEKATYIKKRYGEAFGFFSADKSFDILFSRFSYLKIILEKLNVFLRALMSLFFSFIGGQFFLKRKNIINIKNKIN